MSAFSAMPADMQERIRSADAAVPPRAVFEGAMAKVAKAAKDDPPRPLLRELPPATPYPVAALGEVLGPAAEAIEAVTRAPVAIAAQSVLAAAALSVQGYADVALPTGQERPVSAFFLTIAASGERKSACDHEALWPIRKREEALRAEHGGAIESYENGRAAWESARMCNDNSCGRLATIAVAG